LNAIALLGEIFHQVRLPDGSPIKVLASAVLHYQDMLLSGEEHEMELFTTQVHHLFYYKQILFVLVGEQVPFVYFIVTVNFSMRSL
jgi:hypothetical protein